LSRDAPRSGLPGCLGQPLVERAPIEVKSVPKGRENVRALRRLRVPPNRNHGRSFGVGALVEDMREADPGKQRPQFGRRGLSGLRPVEMRALGNEDAQTRPSRE